MMKLTPDEQASTTSPNTLLRSSSERTFEERADEIANIFLEGLKEGVKAEQERQQQFEAAAQRLVEQKLREHGIYHDTHTHSFEKFSEGAIPERLPGHIPGIQMDDNPFDDDVSNTRGLMEKAADTFTGDCTYEKVGKPV